MSPLNDDNLVRATVAVAISKKDVLERLKLRAAGGNYKSLDAACARLGISVKRSVALSARKKKVPIEDIFIENSKYERRVSIKRLLLELGHLENRCYGLGCMVSTHWLGTAISLQLDHINGIYNDNRIVNLRLLCPNCHSQTETFCGKKTRLRNRECECGKAIKRSSTNCISCAMVKRHSETKLLCVV